MTTTNHDPSGITDMETIRERLQALGLWGVLSHWSEVQNAPWLAQILQYEEAERARRSLERRLSNARIGSFKLATDFDWVWPRKIDREAVEELFGGGYVAEGTNAVFYGPNGVGKTMFLKNLAHQALLRGNTVRFTTASEMLADLAAQDSSASLNRRVSRYVHPSLLCIDEVGYLSYDSRYADLLFEVVTRRYQAPKSIVLSTNKRFADWPQVFPNASCVVTLVDRLLHRCECIEIDADSYRLKEAKEREAARAKARATRRKKSQAHRVDDGQVPLPDKETSP
jgi:DNA replication protein DnaC